MVVSVVVLWSDEKRQDDITSSLGPRAIHVQQNAAGPSS